MARIPLQRRHHLSGAAERRRGAGGPPRGSRAGRPRGHTARARRPHRDRDLCRAGRAGQPHRPCAGGGYGAGARQPRAAARAEQPDDGGLLAGHAEGRADRRADHAAAAREGAEAGHRQSRGGRGALRCPASGRTRCQPAGRRRALLPQPEDGALLQRHRPGRAGDGAGRQARHLHRLRHRRRRHLPDRLHQRHHRPAQGHDALPPRRAGDVRPVPAPRAQAHGGRHLLRHAAAGVHLRAGWDAVFSAADRGEHGAGREAHARDAAEVDPGSPRDHRLHGSDLLSPDGHAGAAVRPLQPEEERLRRRGAAGRHAPGVEGGHRHRDDRWAGRH
ncbi:hypothetical protein D3C87_1316770 [compost metagenome]